MVLTLGCVPASLERVFKMFCIWVSFVELLIQEVWGGDGPLFSTKVCRKLAAFNLSFPDFLHTTQLFLFLFSMGTRTQDLMLATCAVVLCPWPFSCSLDWVNQAFSQSLVLLHSLLPFLCILALHFIICFCHSLFSFFPFLNADNFVLGP